MRSFFQILFFAGVFALVLYRNKLKDEKVTTPERTDQEKVQEFLPEDLRVFSSRKKLIRDLNFREQVMNQKFQEEAEAARKEGFGAFEKVIDSHENQRRLFRANYDRMTRSLKELENDERQRHKDSGLH